MAVNLAYDEDPDSIRSAMAILRMDWPDIELFRWAESPEWIAHHAHWWHVWDGESFAGFLAAVDLGRRRWAFHFGARRSFSGGRVMLAAWSRFLAIAEAEGVGLVVAYIPEERPEIRRVARIFKFRRFNQKLWVFQNRQKSHLRRKKPHG